MENQLVSDSRKKETRPLRNRAPAEWAALDSNQ